MLKIFNKIWSTNCFPKLWKEAIVIPILKPGKDKTEPTSYRPISLTCNMSKILEKIINNRLTRHLEMTHALKDNQFGFRKGLSTTDHLLSIDNLIRGAFKNKQHVITVCLDIQKAFDMVWTRLIINKLAFIGLHGNILQFINNFTTNRNIKTRINGKLSSPYHMENGVPQGSALSPTLFLLVIETADDSIPPPVVTRKYADDLVILCKGKNIEDTQFNVQQALNQLSVWSQKTGFKFSASKTNTMIFTKQHKPANYSLKLEDKLIPRVNSIKILGLIFQPNLTYPAHINRLVLDCKKRLNILKALACKNWGSNIQVLKTTYNALIRSKIDYVSTLYQAASKETLHKLDAIHHTALRIATGVFRTCTIGSLLAEAQETSLQHRRDSACIKIALKSLSSKNLIVQNNLKPPIPPNRDTHQKYPSLYERFHTLNHNLNLTLPQITTNQPCKFNDTWKINAHKIKIHWNQEWKKLKVNVIHKNMNDFFSLKTPTKLKRKDQVILTRIRTGHTKLTHNHLLDNSPPPNVKCAKRK